MEKENNYGTGMFNYAHSQCYKGKVLKILNLSTFHIIVVFRMTS
jgi:hypothetical protein